VGLYDDDLLLLPALEAVGIRGVPAVWSRAGIDWASFDALLMRSPWDYFERAAEFRGWLDERIASGVLMCNSPEILDWNFDKSYLQDLARKGVELVPTICIARNEKADIAALARARGWNEIVVKPTIGGGGYRTHRLRLDELPHYAGEIAEILEDRGLLVQLFLPEIANGELSLLFFDGVYSHAALKRPKAGEYRVQFQYGGTNENAEPSAELIAQAHVCITHCPAPPVYARVDGVVKDGRFLLMELEVFEPLMFLARHPEAPGRFARAIAGRLPK
jgi:glutathione synthase/RimK-type ligase-like ATP-grasp enzyme